MASQSLGPLGNALGVLSSLAQGLVVCVLHVLRRGRGARQVASRYAHAAWLEIGARHWGWALFWSRLSVALDPSEGRGHALMALAYLRSRDRDGARRACDEAARAPRRNAWTSTILGDVELELRRLPEAEAAYRHALALTPDEPWALAKLALALVLQGRLDEAEPLLEHARRLAPTDARILAMLGELRVRQGRFEEGLVALDEAVRIDAGLARAHYYLGIALSGMKRWQEGLREVQMAAELDPAEEAYQTTLSAMVRWAEDTR